MCCHKHIRIEHTNTPRSISRKIVLCHKLLCLTFVCKKEAWGKKRILPTDKNDFRWWGGKTLKMLFWVFLSLFSMSRGHDLMKTKVHGEKFHFFTLFGSRKLCEKLRARPPVYVATATATDSNWRLFLNICMNNFIFRGMN